MPAAPLSHTPPSAAVLQAYASLPDRYLILTPDLIILTATDAYLAATLTVREDIVGRSVYDVFPESPDESSSFSKQMLHASFQRVLATGRPDQLPVQRYDVRRAGAEEAGFEEKYWLVQNSPVLTPDGAVQYLINKVSEVTELVRQGHRIDDLSREVDLTKALVHENRLLVQQLQKANAILDSIGEAYVELSAAGEFTYLNRRAEQLLQVTKAEILGQNIWQTTLLRVSPEGQDLIRQALRTGRRTEDEYHCSVLGRWVYMSATPTADGLIVLLYDIQEVKESRERLRQEHQRLKESQAMGHIGSFEVELPSGRVYWTDELYRIYGLPPQSQPLTVEQIVGFLYAEDVNAFRELLQPVGASARFQLVHRIIRHDGTTRLVETRTEAQYDAQGAVTKLYGTVQDVTEMKQAEKELRESVSQFQALVENTPDIITRWDQALRLTFANGAYCQRMQRPLADMLGKTNLEMGHPEDMARPWMDKLRLVLSSGQAHDHYNQAETPVGTKYFYSRLVPEVSEEGEVRSVLAIAREITDIRRLEKENLHLQLLQQKQLLNAVLEAQEEERRRIAESLHNGLGQVLYATKLQLEQIVVEPGQASSRRTAEARQQASLFLSEAIKTTRTISHELIPTTLEDFGLATAIKDVCQHMSCGAVRIRCQLLGRGPRLDKYLELALYRLVQELVNNIVKHAQATQAQVVLTLESAAVRLRADDNGRGFDPLRPGGKGIGLKTIRDRVKLLNGTTDVRSAPGQGTSVSIWFPVEPERTKQQPT
ncbi:PAS domain-containing protein [Hymenobacter sp. BT635]|uniref:Oxygen sensor histidine kinase NreB n=1 Tax=Hymenobacter nitidus TaxID=2880929 RepID=A0ABS8AL36_9BACT|nr:PAS domain-containing sensor histidine kinase [Hymenobacter nitidus]MCB2379955.1 PAS domain-containing protein [Hymenobacter nitidus]